MMDRRIGDEHSEYVEAWQEQVQMISEGSCMNVCERTGEKTFILTTGRKVRFEAEDEAGLKEMTERCSKAQVCEKQLVHVR